MMGLRALIIGGVLAAALPGLAAAQVPSASRNGFRPQFQGKDQRNTREKAPPALPGAQAAFDLDTTKGQPLDLPPTESLFDAINRGDITEARDALARGADLQAQNVLGMTPIALSVDLGRNDITFLLLSYRTGGATPPPPGAAASGPPPAKPGRQVSRVAADGAKPATTARLRARPSAQAASQPRASASSPNPNVTAAGTPGVPVPQAGFLGFGSPAQN